MSNVANEMNSHITEKIITAVKSTTPDAATAEIVPETRFEDIPGFDSMSIVTFQIELSSLIGDRAQTLLPMMDMTISEYAEALSSL